MTAESSVKAPQFEVLLKVKQTQNDKFAFLYPDHDLHPYYILLKRRKRNKDVTDTDDNDKEGAKKDNAALVEYESYLVDEDFHCVTGLLGMYSPSDDEGSKCGDDNPGDENEINACVTISDVGVTKTDDNQSTDQKSSPVKLIPSKHVTNETANEQCHQLSSGEQKAKQLKRAQMLNNKFPLKTAD